jgi:RNA polymerase sigma-70 factor (ECF subfamily)
MRAVRQRPERAEVSRTTESSVARLPLPGSDAEILGALRAGTAAGGAALYDRYHRQVRRVMIRVLGYHGDLSDLVQDTFITAINTIQRVDGPQALRPWLTSIAVFTARQEIRRRARRRFFRLTAYEDLPDVEAPRSSPEADEALRTTYRLLGRMPADERIAFALRFIDGMELTEVAAACRVSLATIKRRVQRARQRFEAMASHYEELSEWLEGGR